MNWDVEYPEIHQLKLPYARAQPKKRPKWQDCWELMMLMPLPHGRVSDHVSQIGQPGCIHDLIQDKFEQHYKHYEYNFT